MQQHTKTDHIYSLVILNTTVDCDEDANWLYQITGNDSRRANTIVEPNLNLTICLISHKNRIVGIDKNTGSIDTNNTAISKG